MSDESDKYVLQVFLPLLAIAILGCAGGCCYMERRRKKRLKKNEGQDEDHMSDAAFDDTASVVSSSSARRRHYLLPTQTTGRLVRGASVRSNYSNFGEPLYETRKKMQSSTRSNYSNSRSKERADRFHNYERDNASREFSSGYGGRPLTRSYSMMNINRSNYDDQPSSLRRVRSSQNVNEVGASRTDYAHENIDNDSENLYEMLSARSEENTRSGSNARRSSRPSSMVDFPLGSGERERNGLNRTRSLSQPDLTHFENIRATSYPQGILKRGQDYPVPVISNQTSCSSDSGIKDIYKDVNEINGRASRMSRNHILPHMPNMHSMMQNSRPSSRPASVMSYSSNSTNRNNSKSYYHNAYSNNRYNNAPRYNGYNDQSMYAITNGSYHHHQIPRNNDIYGMSYDPYNVYHSNYRGHRTLPGY